MNMARSPVPCLYHFQFIEAVALFADRIRLVEVVLAVAMVVLFVDKTRLVVAVALVDLVEC